MVYSHSLTDLVKRTSEDNPLADVNYIRRMRANLLHYAEFMDLFGPWLCCASLTLE